MLNATNATCHLGGFHAITPFIVPFQIGICVLSVVGNSIVIVAVFKFHVLRTATNQFVMALAVSDLCVGLNIPFYVSFYFDVGFVCDPRICLARYFVTLWSIISSMLLMIGVAVDRYLSVMLPFQYPLLMNRRVSLSSVCSIYGYVTLVCVLPIVWTDATTKDLSAMSECDLFDIFQPLYATLAVGFHVLLTLIATTVLYALIFREGNRRRQDRKHVPGSWFHLHRILISIILRL